MFMLPRKFVGVVLRSTSVVSWWSAFLVNLEDLEYRCKVKTLQNVVLPYSKMISILTTYPTSHPYRGIACNNLYDTTKKVLAPYQPQVNLFPPSSVVPFSYQGLHTNDLDKLQYISYSHSVFSNIFPSKLLLKTCPLVFSSWQTRTMIYSFPH